MGISNRQLNVGDRIKTLGTWSGRYITNREGRSVPVAREVYNALKKAAAASNYSTVDDLVFALNRSALNETDAAKAIRNAIAPYMPQDRPIECYSMIKGMLAHTDGIVSR